MEAKQLFVCLPAALSTMSGLTLLSATILSDLTAAEAYQS